MTNSIDEKELHKLSEIIIENDEIISDVNNLIKEMKSFKEIDQQTYDKYLKKCEELQMDIDDILDVIEKCQKENEPNLKSFDSNKNSSKIKAQKSKKQLEEWRIKLEKRIQKNSENTVLLSKGFINNDNESIINPIDKNKMNINQSEEAERKTEEFFDEAEENEKSNHQEKMKASLSSDDNENQNLRKKGILKASFKKNNKAEKETNNKRVEDTNIENEITDKATNRSNDNDNSLKSDELNTQIEKKSKNSKLKIKNKKRESKKDETTYPINTKTSESQMINLDKKNGEIDKKNNENINKIKNPNKINNKKEKTSDKISNQTFNSKLNDLKPIEEKKNLQITDVENIQMKNIKKEMKDQISKDINDVTDDDDYDESENDQIISVNNEETKLTNSKNDQDLNSTNKSQILKMQTNKEEILVSANTNDILYYSENEGIHSIEIKNNEGADTWNQLKQSMQEKSVDELLKSLGSLPSGFRHSTLKLWCQENSIKSSFVAYLCPNLTESHMSLSDLQYVMSTKQIRPQQVRIQRQIQVIKVTQIPLISDKFIVKSRHVRICLFDGQKAVSNIHTMRASVNEKDLKIWNFNSKMTEIMKSLDYNEIFIRSNHPSTENTILMEFCILGFKTEVLKLKKLKLSNEISITKIDEMYTDDELIELSIGWTIIPLYETNGQLLNSKKSDYILNGGTPFEKNLEVDSDIKSENPGILKSLASQNKQPHVTVRIYIPNKENKDLLETLPNEIIGSTLHLVILSLYRRILASEILDGRQDLTSTRPVCSPFLTSFVEASNYSDILDILRIIWNEKIKLTKTINRKDYGKLNEFFEKIYMDYIYPLTKINLFSNVNLANQELEQNRINTINEFVQRVKQDTLSVLLSDEYAYTPLRFEEFNFNMISKYSKLVSQ